MVKSGRASVTWMLYYEKMKASYRFDYRGLLIFLCNSQGLENSSYPSVFSVCVYVFVREGSMWVRFRDTTI